MQYLLDEEEMARVRAEREEARKMPNLEALTNVVKHVACHMVEVGPNLPNGRKPRDEPHGCIHVPDPRGERYGPGYCDYCPIAGICPLPKNWSK